MDWGKIQLGLGGALGGAIVLAIIAFKTGGVVISSTAQKMAEEAAEVAVVGRLAPICVVRFNQDSQKDQKLKELQKKDSWLRGVYVAKQGWATMPGEKKPDDRIAEKCAILLVQ